MTPQAARTLLSGATNPQVCQPSRSAGIRAGNSLDSPATRRYTAGYLRSAI